MRYAAKRDSVGSPEVHRTGDRTVPPGTAGVFLFVPGRCGRRRRTAFANNPRRLSARRQEFLAAGRVAAASWPTKATLKPAGAAPTVLFVRRFVLVDDAGLHNEHDALEFGDVLQ